MDGGGRRRVAPKSSAEDQALDQIAKEAEARLAARRAARAEARDIRMREVERQQREQEENADRQFDMLEQPTLLGSVGATGRTSAAAAILRTTPNMRLTPGGAGSYLSSRRSSEDSLEDTGSLRELRHELKDVEEKFRKAMIANAQLDNDKSSQTYQLELLKDRIEELEEAHAQLRREHRDKCRDFDQLQRQADRLKQDLNAVRAQLEDRDRLIAEKGLVIVGGEDDLSEDGSFVDTSGGNGGGMVNGGGSTIKRALVSAENAQMLEHAGEGSLDVRLARFAKERSEFQDTTSHLRLELEEERNRRRKNSGMLNGPSSDADFDDQHRVASKQLDDYKFRAQKAEQDVATLQANVARLESQVIRYKSAAEASEKSEEALKTEKRKLQREARDAQSRAEELETANTHLIKRLDKLKTAKSALLKDL